MKKTIKKKNGFTLQELILVTGLISIAFVGIYAAYVKADTYMNVLEETKNIDMIREGVISLAQNEKSYLGLTNNIVNTSQITPQSMRDTTPDGIISSFSSPVTVTPMTIGAVSSNNAFSIQYTSVPEEYCSKIVAQAATKFDELRVNGTVVKSAGAFEVNAAALATACDGSPSNGATVNFIAVSSMMNSLANASGVISPVVASIRPIYNTPLIDTTTSNTNHVSGEKARWWGSSTVGLLANNPVTINANARTLGYGYDGPIAFSAPQKTVDIVHSGLDSWVKAHVAANGGNIPAFWSVPEFDNDARYFMQVVAISTLADAVGYPRGGSLPAIFGPYIADFKTYVGTP